MNYSNREQLREGDTIYAGKSFQLKRRIGNGGMGEVWLVEDLDIHVELAMKSPLLIFNENNNRSDLSDDRTTDYLIKELFYNEAKSLLLMGNYNNVVKCYYAHIINNHVHIFLEYVEGHNLTEYIELN